MPEGHRHGLSEAAEEDSLHGKGEGHRKHFCSHLRKGGFPRLEKFRSQWKPSYKKEERRETTSQETRGNVCHPTLTLYLTPEHWAPGPRTEHRAARHWIPGHRGKSEDFKWEKYAAWERGVEKKRWIWGQPHCTLTVLARITSSYFLLSNNQACESLRRFSHLIFRFLYISVEKANRWCIFLWDLRSTTSQSIFWLEMFNWALSWQNSRQLWIIDQNALKRKRHPLFICSAFPNCPQIKTRFFDSLWLVDRNCKNHLESAWKYVFIYFILFFEEGKHTIL